MAVSNLLARFLSWFSDRNVPVERMSNERFSASFAGQPEFLPVSDSVRRWVASFSKIDPDFIWPDRPLKDYIGSDVGMEFDGLVREIERETGRRYSGSQHLLRTTTVAGFVRSFMSR